MVGGWYEMVSENTQAYSKNEIYISYCHSLLLQSFPLLYSSLPYIRPMRTAFSFTSQTGTLSWNSSFTLTIYRRLLNWYLVIFHYFLLIETIKMCLHRLFKKKRRRRVLLYPCWTYIFNKTHFFLCPRAFIE